jgi:hypothetical protein
MVATNPYFQSVVGGSDLQSAAYFQAGLVAGVYDANLTPEQRAVNRAKADTIMTGVSLATFGIIPSPLQLALTPPAIAIASQVGGALVAPTVRAVSEATNTIKTVSDTAQKTVLDTIDKPATDIKNTLFLVLVALILLEVFRK